jgi:cell volume regulation protein A
VFVSAGVVGVVLHLLLGLSWQLALLYGAVLSSTDAAAVFSTLRRLHIRPLAAILEAESGINDAPAVILVITLSQLAGGEHRPVVAAGAAGDLRAGAGAGDRASPSARRRWPCARWLCRRPALPAGRGRLDRARVRGRGRAHASGFLAVYVAGVVLGNAQLPHRQPCSASPTGWPGSARSAVRHARAARLAAGCPARLPALLVGIVLVLLARPLSVASRDLVPVRLAGAGVPVLGRLRGAVPIVLATIPLSLGWPGASALRRDLRAGRGVHRAAGRHDRPGRPLARRHRAGRADRAAGGDRAAGPHAGRPAGAVDPGGFPAGRGPHRRVAAAAGR